MERHQAVARVWNWLPAFRAVAEYEGLQRAALALSVSPSALSRTVTLLEETLGVALFVRSAAGLALTDAGTELLTAAREAMRRVHDALPESEVAEGLRAGAVGPVLRALLGDTATDLVSDSGGDARLVLSELARGEIAEVLRRGDVDVVLCHEAVAQPGLRGERVGELAWVLAVPPGGTRERVVRLEGDELVPGANVVVTEPRHLASLAQRLGVSMIGPASLVPAEWGLAERYPPRPVFWIEREARTARPPALAALHERLVSTLSTR